VGLWLWEVEQPLEAEILNSQFMSILIIGLEDLIIVSKLKVVDLIYFDLFSIFLFLELRIRVRVTRSHCHTSVTSNYMVTVIVTSHKMHGRI